MAMLRAFVAAVVGALVSSAAAHAADVPDSWSPPESPAPLIEMVSGWYLRGDVGYRDNRIDSVDANPAVASQSFGRSVAVGGGAGYKYRFFRADVTVDYGLKTKFEGTTAAATTQPQYSVYIQPLTVLGNVYLDLGTWYGFSPYIGIGAGGTYTRGLDYKNSALASVWDQNKGNTWSWSWAWMAGLSYQMSQHWIIDAGYRQLYLGDAVTGRDSTNSFLTFNKLTAQEIRVGLRFMIE